MRNKAISLYLAMFASAGSFIVHGEGNIIQELLLKKHDGTSLSFLVQDNPIITFCKDDSSLEAKMMRVMTESVEIEIPMEELEEMTVATKAPAGVENLITVPQGSFTDYHYNNEILWIRNSNENGRVLLIGTDGMTYIDRLIPVGESELPLVTLSKGVYVLSINGESIKIKKQ